jgi:glycosyltransferase involved in cell wall biosynthesis
VAVRISHAHTANFASARHRGIFGLAPLLRYQYRLMRRWTAEFASVHVACSKVAAAWQFGPGWESNPHCHLLPSAIDLAPFKTPVDRAEVRRELGLPDGLPIVGHVARFSEEKNHALTVDVIEECAKRGQDLRFLLVGSGPLLKAIENSIRQRGLSRFVVFTGGRRDVPRLMRGAMDILLLPSLWEGLGLVALEGQAAGLPVVASNRVPDDVDIVPGMVEHVSLDESSAVWTDRVLARLAAGRPNVRALEMVQQSPFSIQNSVRALETLYTRYAGLPAAPSLAAP